VLIRGEFYLRNVLYGNGRIVLIDWESAAPGQLAAERWEMAYCTARCLYLYFREISIDKAKLPSSELIVESNRQPVFQLRFVRVALGQVIHVQARLTGR
jgi:thiamine kinase-like enzyme